MAEYARPSGSLAGIRNDNALVFFDGGVASGIEFFLKYDRGGKFSYWISYALAKATDQVKEIQFDGILTKRVGSVPKLNNQRHTIYLDANYRPDKKWHLNLSWIYYVGWPRTDYTYDITTLPNGDYHFYQVHKVFNATEYPPYHRLDLRINRSFDFISGKMTVFLHLVNLYNRKNLKKFDLDTQSEDGKLSIDKDGNYVPVRDDKYWFGFLPVFGASYNF